jgi:hypothetical protein
MTTVYESQTGKIVKRGPASPTRQFIAFNGQYELSMANLESTGHATGWVLCAQDGTGALATLGIDFARADGCMPEFSPDERHVAWGDQDGTITVADIPEVRRRLNEIGLGW